MGELVPVAKIENRIFQVRGRKVMLDRDLAELYGVETKVLNQAVKRNITRFPSDFMFFLSREEIMRMSQIVTSLKFHKSVAVFTEQGVSMLSSVLNSERAIQVNIQIMRAFANMRRIALTYTALKRKIDEMEKKYDSQFGAVFKAIRQLMAPPPEPPKRRIGFKAG
jgi:chlorite dismutase